MEYLEYTPSRTRDGARRVVLEVVQTLPADPKKKLVTANPLLLRDLEALSSLVGVSDVK
jgi:hypothetical protein